MFELLTIAIFIWLLVKAIGLAFKVFSDNIVAKNLYGGQGFAETRKYLRYNLEENLHQEDRL